MVRTQSFRYFNYNNALIKQTKRKMELLKHNILNSISTIRTNNNKREETTTIKKKYIYIDYHIREEENAKEKKQVFNLVLVEINSTKWGAVKCTKKNMYEDLKYIAISYRWGELSEQLCETPDYTAHITSFELNDLVILCEFIKKEPTLKDIQYLWIDTISVNQLDDKRKKDTILKMSDIFKTATYILAVPDMHRQHLYKNPANKEVLDLIMKHSKVIYTNIFNSIQSTNENKIEENEAIKSAYQFLAYLIEDWSNRAWVISEYHIAKKKERTEGVPLKYMFLSLFDYYFYEEPTPFFSHSFDHQLTNNNTHNNSMSYMEVDNSNKFIEFLKTKFTHRTHLDMILNSNATKHIDRFNAILPSWKEYYDSIEDKSVISKWDISNMTTVRLKLYEIMNLWDKAELLHACSSTFTSTILPSFASHYEGRNLQLKEKADIDSAYKIYLEMLVNYKKSINMKTEDTKSTKNCIKIDIIKSGPLYTKNLTSIQLERSHHYHFLSLKTNAYFIYKFDPTLYQELFPSSILDNDDDFMYVFIPFFTFTESKYANIPPIYGSGIRLLGNFEKNKWIVHYEFFKSSSYGLFSYQPGDCTFRIY